MAKDFMGNWYSDIEQENFSYVQVQDGNVRTEMTPREMGMYMDRYTAQIESGNVTTEHGETVTMRDVQAWRDELSEY